MDDDDEDMRGQATLVMRPEDPPSDAEPATLLKSPPEQANVPPRGGTMQMRQVDPFARTVPPGREDLEPVVIVGAPATTAPVREEPSHEPPLAPAPLGSAPPFIAPLVPPVEDLAPPKKSALPVLLGVAIGLFSVLSVVGVFILVLGPKPEERRTSASGAPTTAAASATASATAETIALSLSSAPEKGPASAGVAASTDASASGQAVPPPEGPEAEAIAALERLKTAIETCVKTKIHKLPGTSPAVPPALTYLKNGPYKPLITDWTSPFFSCAPLKIETPMPFVIQWQFRKSAASGMGIAWLDLDGNGVADKAYAFTAKLEKKDDLVFTPIEPTDAISHRPEKAH